MQSLLLEFGFWSSLITSDITRCEEPSELQAGVHKLDKARQDSFS